MPDQSRFDLVDQVLDGRYRVVRRIAEGGMAAVYEAEQLNVARSVAIKVLRPEISHHPDMLARFRSEAKIISELRHPNTLKLIDYGATEDGMLYLVTELLSGEPLSVRLKRSALSPLETLHVLREVLRSLHEAHERGVIHRDLKPGNIFLEEVAGQTLVKVLDFGIAKMKTNRSEDPDQPSTAEGMLLGTPAYLSPEQAGGATIDARSDIYSLGAVAYHCLSGQVPFEGEPVAQIMAHVSQAPTPFDELVPPAKVPTPMAELVYRWLSKNPKQRPASATAALAEVDELQAVLTGASASAPVPRTSDASLNQTLAAAAGFLVIGGLVALSFVGGPARSKAVDGGPSSDTAAPNVAPPPVFFDLDVGPGDTGETDARAANDDAGWSPDAAVPRGLRVLQRPTSGGWASLDEVRRVLARIEPVALDCHRRTQIEDKKGRTLTMTFIVREAGVSVQISPKDDAGARFKRCLSLRVPSLSWPDRNDVSTAGLVIGDGLKKEAP